MNTLPLQNNKKIISVPYIYYNLDLTVTWTGMMILISTRLSFLTVFNLIKIKREKSVIIHAYICVANMCCYFCVIQGNSNLSQEYYCEPSIHFFKSLIFLFIDNYRGAGSVSWSLDASPPRSRDHPRQGVSL